MKKSVLLTALFLLWKVSCPSLALAMLIPPTVDGTIFDGAQGPYDGQGDYINDSGWPQALNNVNFESRAVLEYNLSSFSGTVSSAVLNLPALYMLGPFPFTLQLYSYAADGSLAIADYSAGNFLSSLSYNGGSLVTYDVTSAVQNASGSYIGFNIRKLEQNPQAPGQPYVSFGSLEHSPATFLAVNEPGSSAVPEPSSLILLGVGLAAVAWRTRDRLGHVS